MINTVRAKRLHDCNRWNKFLFDSLSFFYIEMKKICEDTTSII